MQFGRFLGRVAGFGARALPAVQCFGNTAGNFLHKGSAIGTRVAKLARSGLDALEKSELGRILGVGELIGVGRDASNFVDMASRAANRVGDLASNVDFFNYVPRPVAPPAEMIRHYLTPTSGGAPQTGGPKAEFSIPCSNPGLHLDPSQTVLSFQINNNNAVLSVYFGSVNISSIDEYGALFVMTQDFTTDMDSLRSSGTVRGVADFLPAAVATAANIKDAYYSRAGATIAAGGSLIVALPLMSVLGTLAMKAIPLSQLQDSIKLEVKWAVQTNWGTYADAPSALTGCTIPIRVSQACNIFVVLRESAVTNGFSHKMISQRTKAGMIDHRFKVGAIVIPKTAINCTGSAAEARMEVQRVFGSGVADAAARSCISAEQFIGDGYAVGLSLAAFPSSDALSDGISTRNMHVVFESKISTRKNYRVLEWPDDVRELKRHVWIKNAIIDLFRFTLVLTMIKNEILLEFLLDLY
ncbi:hypothetical protein T492DRAFT_836211 [Pavlovales sp. CCMP2436]|nr:hypothetical protein T492DRAFT_836211 [Pavlovales sp. CCMP2436]